MSCADKQTRTEALAQEQQTLQARVEELHGGDARADHRDRTLFGPDRAGRTAALSELEAERAGLSADESEQRKQLQIEEQSPPPRPAGLAACSR
jgi:hypothetical protein